METETRSIGVKDCSLRMCFNTARLCLGVAQSVFVGLTSAKKAIYHLFFSTQSDLYAEGIADLES